MTPMGTQDNRHDADRRAGPAHTKRRGRATAGGVSRRRRIALFAAVVAFAPTLALAHVKWFENEALYPVRADLVFSGRTFLLIVVCAVALALLYGLQRILGDPHWPDFRFLKRTAVGAPTILAVQAAIGLVYAASQLTLFAPNLRTHPPALALAFAAVQLFIAFSFITGVGDWIGALALIALGPLAFLVFPAFDVTDQLFWAGIGVAVLVIGRGSVEAGQARPWFQARSAAWPARAVAALRVITGVAIISPALDEKVWNPAMGAAFLAHYPTFNFPRAYVGLRWFTDERFVLAAGIAEALIGVLLISGLLTRVVILGMWLPFNVGVPFLPPQELLGHLPIFGIMYVLLVHSSGIAIGESVHQSGLTGSPSEETEKAAAGAPRVAMTKQRAFHRLHGRFSV